MQGLQALCTTTIPSHPSLLQIFLRDPVRAVPKYSINTKTLIYLLLLRNMKNHVFNLLHPFFLYIIFHFVQHVTFNHNILYNIVLFQTIANVTSDQETPISERYSRKKTSLDTYFQSFSKWNECFRNIYKIFSIIRNLVSIQIFIVQSIWYFE